MKRSPKGSGENKNCQVCDKQYYCPPYRIASSKFCSSKCRGESSKKKFTKACIICNKEFEFIASRIDKTKYCSNSCYYKGQRNKGKTDYTCKECNIVFKSSLCKKRQYCTNTCFRKAKKKEWKGKFVCVRNAMKRKGLLEKCNRCNFNQYIQILGVHHKDRNRNNNKLDNLEVLCPNCHSIEHMRHTPHGFTK